jgi:RNA polymerase sigma-70 factor (ECF subfamily)
MCHETTSVALKEVIGAPVGTVMSRLARGRERLRALLDASAAPTTLKVIK